MMRAFLIAALIVMPTYASATQFYDGNKLNDLCRDQRGVVMGYMAGWLDKQDWDASVAWSLWFNQEQAFKNRVMPRVDQINANVCVPGGVSLSQPTDIVCNYLASHPETRQYDANDLVGKALAEAWPCKK